MQKILRYFLSAFALIALFLPAKAQWLQSQKVFGAALSKGSDFGYSVSVSGDYAIVGAPEDALDSAGLNPKEFAGSAYILKKSETGDWDVVQKLSAYDRSGNSIKSPWEKFGYSVSISGNYAVVGAHGQRYNESGADSLNGAGAAYIYIKKANDRWELEQKITPSDRVDNDRFGKSVSIHGYSIIVGASSKRHTPSGTVWGAGAAYIYERAAHGGWLEVLRLDSPDPKYDGRFGFSVDITDSAAIVGSMEGGSGLAFLFKKNPFNVWEYDQRIEASDRQGGDAFGHSVAIDGTRALVGAPNEDHDTSGQNALQSSGSAYVFELNNVGVWEETQKITANDRDTSVWFGWSVALKDDIVLIGARGAWGIPAGINRKSHCGAAYVFNYTGNRWNQWQKIMSEPLDYIGDFGNSVAIGEDHLFCGEPGRGSTGGVIVFKKDPYLVVEKYGQDSDISAWPNPTTGNLFIDLDREYNDVSVAVFSLTGQVVSERNYGQTSKISTVLNGPKGIYLVQINLGTEVRSLKVIKE